MNLLDKLLERGHLEAYASIYPELYEANPESTMDFAGDLLRASFRWEPT